MGDFFTKKKLFKKGKFFGQIYGKEGVLHGGTNDQIMLRESIANGFSSNMSTVNLNIFGNVKVNTKE